MSGEKIIRILLFCFCCIVITGCGSNNYNLTGQSGEVFYNSSRPDAGAEIKNGDTIATGIDSFAALSNDKNRIFLFPESQITAADVNNRIYSISNGEAVFVNNNRGSIIIKNDPMQFKIAGKSIISILKSEDYFEICSISGGAELLSGDRKIPLPAGARSVIYENRILSSRPLGMLEINKLRSMSGISDAGDLKRFYIKRDNLPGSKLAKLYLNYGPLKRIKTRSGRVIIGSMTVTGNSAVIQTENGEMKLKTGDILSVQSYDRF